jgi:hypothetical protein
MCRIERSRKEKNVQNEQNPQVFNPELGKITLNVEITNQSNHGNQINHS